MMKLAWRVLVQST